MRRAPGTGCIFRPSFRTPSGELRRGRLWWIAYRVAGQLKREPAKTQSRQEAERLLRSRLAGLDRGELPATDRATWEDLVSLIRSDYRANGRRSSARLEVSLRQLDRTFAPTDRAASITADRLAAYVARRLDEDGAARATVNRELSVVRRAFRLAHRAGRVLVVPHVAMLREDNARTGFFERHDFDRLRKALPEDVRTPALVAYLTGWRMTSELLTRQWHHVDLRAGWLRLEPGETKNGRGRQFPLFPELRAALRAQRKRTAVGCPWVFHHGGEPLFYRTEAGGLLPSAYLRDAWSAACTKAGLEGRIRHDFRRTAARDLLRSGVPVPTVMRAMGWESEAMLRRYAVVDEGALIEAGRKRAKLR